MDLVMGERVGWVGGWGCGGGWARGAGLGKGVGGCMGRVGQDVWDTTQEGTACAEWVAQARRLRGRGREERGGGAFLVFSSLAGPGGLSQKGVGEKSG